MQKWEFLQIHVESSKSRLNVSVNANEMAEKKEFDNVTGLMRYLNSLGAEGWEMVNADRNEYGFQNYFFKRPVE
jgi:hypothetical protein